MKTLLLFLGLAATLSIYGQVDTNNTVPAIAALAKVASTNPTPEKALADSLVKRDTEILDLELLGKTLVKDYGRGPAWSAVTNQWNELTKGAPLSRAKDMPWVVDQPPRVRDVAWMISRKEDWMPEVPAPIQPPPPAPAPATNPPPARIPVYVIPELYVIQTPSGFLHWIPEAHLRELSKLFPTARQTNVIIWVQP